MEDATRNGQSSTARTVELDTAPRPVVATVPQASRAARKSSQQVRIVATGENLLSAALPDLTPARRAERRARMRAAFRSTVERALERRAQLFVIVGDLFAAPAPENVDRAFVAQELARLRDAGVICVAVAGPRDIGSGAGDDAPYRLYESGADLRFFPPGDALQPALVVIDGVRIALAGMSAVSNANTDPLERARFDDPDDVLGRADLAILVLPAQVEDMREAASARGVVSASRLAALPAVFRLVIAGGAPQFGRMKAGKREVVAPGATERHSFAAPAESAGFAWIELNAEGVTLAEHVRVEEQPRVEIEVTTARLFPHGDVADDADNDKYARSGAHLLPVLTPEELISVDSDADEMVAPYTPPAPDVERERVLKRLLDALHGACRPDTMVHVRLTGPLTRRQFHRLPLAEALRYGRQEAFSFELDTSGLVIETERTDMTPGPVSLDDEIDRLVVEYRARLRNDEPEARADVDRAAGLLRAQLQIANSTDREAAR
jgi:hypothetical protein